MTMLFLRNFSFKLMHGFNLESKVKHIYNKAYKRFNGQFLFKNNL